MTSAAMAGAGMMAATCVGDRFAGVDDELLDALRQDASTSAAALTAGIDACCKAFPVERRALLAVALLAEIEAKALPVTVAGGHAVLRCARSGLCNRLRTVLSHALVAAESGGMLTVVWAPSDECPGLFTDHFIPPPGVRFVTGWPVTGADTANAAEAADADAAHTADAVIDANDYHERVKGMPCREALYWRLLEPTPEVAAQVEANVAACGCGPFIAVHVRRTDHYAVAMRRHAHDDAFVTFAQLPPHAPLRIFVATDDAQTQVALRGRLGRRLVVGSHELVAGALRQSGLRASVLDLLTCVRSVTFKGSPYSSFSDGIMRCRQAHGTAHARDEHAFLEPPRDTPYWRHAILTLAAEQRAHGDPTMMRLLAQTACEHGTEPIP